MDKKLIRNIIIIHLIFLSFLVGSLYFVFDLNRFQLFGVIFGVTSTFLTSLLYVKKYLSRTSYLLANGLIGLVIAYFFSSNLSFLTAILLGINATLLYLMYYYDENILKEVSFINVLVLSSIILLSAIEKFRGANKLDTLDIELTIPIITVTYSVALFFIKILKNFRLKLTTKQTLYTLTFVTAALVITTGLESYYIYKEIGFSLIFVPILSGIIAGLLRFTTDKYSPFPEIAQVLLILIYPYTISGIFGISISLLSAYMYNTFVIDELKPKTSRNFNLILALIPILFLLAVSEIRENLGQISRFRIATGYQIGWIFIVTISLVYIPKYKLELKKILTENNIERLYAGILFVFTILITTIIIKFGRQEALVALILMPSLYAFSSSLQAGKELIAYRYNIISYACLAGAMALFMLTRL